MARGTITIDAGQTKGGEPRVFVMTSDLRTLLKRQRVHTDTMEAETGKACPLVLHRRGKSIEDFYDVWRNACEGAKVRGRLILDLRRTANWNLVRAGVSEVVARRCAVRGRGPCSTATT